MTLLTKTLTAEDLWELSHSEEYRDFRLELSNGELIVMAPASFEHGKVGAESLGHIWAFVRANRLGMVTTAETGFVLFRDEERGDVVRAPDVAFVRANRIGEPPKKGYLRSAPDFAVEVVSPNDTGEEIDNKIKDYLRANSPLFWFIYPKSQAVVVYSGATSQRFGIDDTLDGGEVLPGFTLLVRQLFEE